MAYAVGRGLENPADRRASGADGVEARLGEEELVLHRQLAPLELPDALDVWVGAPFFAPDLVVEPAVFAA